MFKKKQKSADKISVLMGDRITLGWTIVNYINKGTYEELNGKSDLYIEGFLDCIEVLRESLIKSNGCD
jgi:hypothetical protein